MKRISLMLLVLIVFGIQGRAMAQAPGTLSIQNVSPPPIRTSHIQEGALSSNNAAIYMGMDSGGIDLKMYGLASEATMAMTDRIALSMVGTGMYGGATADMGTIGKMDLSMGVGVFGINVLVSPVQSEKRNSIGEITKIGSGLSFFGGGQVTMMGVGAMTSIPCTINESAHICSGGMEMKISGNGTIWQLQAGVIGELALHSQFQIVPYAYVGTTAGSLSYTADIGGTPISGSEDIPSSSLTAYGADIVIRPMRTNPKFKISLGTLLQQISGNKGGMTFIMVGVAYEVGARYSETQFGPVLQ